MMRITVWLAVVAVALLAACTSEPEIRVRGERFNDEQLALGEQLYIQNCASCHGVNGEGQFPNAPLQPDATGRLGAPPHNETGHTWHHGDGLLIRYVLEGGVSLMDPANFYPMPAFGDQLSETDVMSIIAYIKTMWTDEQRTRQQKVTEAEVSE